MQSFGAGPCQGPDLDAEAQQSLSLKKISWER